MFNAMFPVSPVCTAPTPRPPHAHLMQIRGERSKVTMGCAGPGWDTPAVSRGINYPGCREDTRVNIYMGIVISASHSEDLISRAPHPSTVLTVSFLPAVAGQRRGR